MNPERDSERSLRRDPFVIVTALATALLLATVWSVTHVAAQDHPNHLASLRVLARLASGDPFYAAHFHVARELVPDLLSEVIWLALLRPLPEVVAGKVLLSAYVVSLPLAWWSFVRRYCASDTALLPVAPLVAMNVYYSLGSTNFLLGLAAFLAACAAWDRVRESPRGALGFALWAGVTWLAHVYDYVFLLAFVAAHVAAAGLGRRPPSPREVACGAGLFAGLAGAAWAVFSGGDEWAASAPTRFDLHPRQLVQVFDQSVFLRGGGGTRYVLFALALASVAALVTHARARTLRSALRPTVALAAGALLAGLWLAPVSVGGEGSIKPRFAVPVFLLALASVALPRGRSLRALTVALLASALAVKLRDEWRVHRRFDREASAVVAAFAREVPRQARVLPVFGWRARGVAETLALHLPDALVLERDALVPDLFDAPGQQVLRYRTPRPERVTSTGLTGLTARALRGYDHVWAQSDDFGALLASVRHCLDPVASRGAHRLFRVRAECRAAGGGDP